MFPESANDIVLVQKQIDMFGTREQNGKQVSIEIHAKPHGCLLELLKDMKKILNLFDVCTWLRLRVVGAILIIRFVLEMVEFSQKVYDEMDNLNLIRGSSMV